ncbi:MAG: T9SS type A sorting domain-containing protein, partial [Bacteroidales bacterium]|nr:T9SS type A sorting domain-containing protein [Bacteroidales bacterium]
DIYGSEPHVLEGEITLSNLGGNVPWISCDIYEGTTAGQTDKEIMVTFNTDGLDDGHYYCNIIVRDNFQHENIIPVHLLVDTDLGSIEHAGSAVQLNVFPNPFSNETNIMLQLTDPDIVSIKVCDLEGRTMAVLADGESLTAGQHSFRWLAGEGAAVENGMYFIIVEYGSDRLVQKIIRYD